MRADMNVPDCDPEDDYERLARVARKFIAAQIEAAEAPNLRLGSEWYEGVAHATRIALGESHD
jgi:hypothetical protein